MNQSILKFLASRNDSLSKKVCLVSGSGNVAQAATQKLIEMGAKVLAMSDSLGHIYDEKGIDAEKLAFIKQLKNIRRGRISEYVDQYEGAVFTPAEPDQESNPLWRHRAP